MRHFYRKFQDEGHAARFIVFTEDIPDDKRARLVSAALVDRPHLDDESDVTAQWRMYLLGELVRLLSDSAADEKFGEGFEQLRQRFLNLTKRGFSGTFDKVRKSFKKAKVTAATGFKQTKLEGEAEFEKVEEAVDNFQVMDDTESILKHLSYKSDRRYCLFIDELNLSMLQHAQHIRDAILIRDLIIAIGRLNRFFSENKLPIFFYCSIRSEILTTQRVAHNEVGKYVSDHGVALRWHSARNVAEYPIMEMLENKIRASEEIHSSVVTEPHDIWNVYFPNRMFNISPRKFLSEITWCAPRDVVSLFNATKSVTHTPYMFDEKVFLSALPEYSEESWTQRREELNVDYAAVEIDAIRSCLNRYDTNFKLEHFEERMKKLSERNPNIRNLIGKRGARRICEDLYHIGVLGMSRPIF